MYACKCMYMCACMYVYMYVCIYVCMYICMYLYSIPMSFYCIDSALEHINL